MIGIVDNWVKDTGWVDECIRQGKHVTLLFSAFQDPNNTIPCEHSEVESFRESLQGRCRCVAYRNAAELKEKVTETLQAHLRNKSAKEPYAGKAVQPNAAIAATSSELFKRQSRNI